MARKNPHIGSSFESWLDDAGIRGDVTAAAIRAVIARQVLPDPPVLADFLPGYEASAWYGIVAPKGTPAEIVNTLNTAVNAVFADPCANLPGTGTCSALGSRSFDDTTTWLALMSGDVHDLRTCGAR